MSADLKIPRSAWDVIPEFCSAYTIRPKIVNREDTHTHAHWRQFPLYDPNMCGGRWSECSQNGRSVCRRRREVFIIHNTWVEHDSHCEIIRLRRKSYLIWWTSKIRPLDHRPVAEACKISIYTARREKHVDCGSLELSARPTSFAARDTGDLYSRTRSPCTAFSAIKEKYI